MNIIANGQKASLFRFQPISRNITENVWGSLFFKREGQEELLIFASITLALRQKQWLQSSREKRSKDKTRPTEYAIA